MTNLPVIQERQDRGKVLLIEQLKKTPIIEIACKKVGIGRATFYRWKKEDQDFAQRVEEALGEGLSMISDLAESKLIGAIQSENMGAIAFWLKAHHSTYRTRVELTTAEKPKEELTPEQAEIVKKALTFGHLIEEDCQEEKQNNEQPAAE